MCSLSTPCSFARNKLYIYIFHLLGINYIYICVCVYICMLYMCVCVYIYIYKHILFFFFLNHAYWRELTSKAQGGPFLSFMVLDPRTRQKLLCWPVGDLAPGEGAMNHLVWDYISSCWSCHFVLWLLGTRCQNLEVGEVGLIYNMCTDKTFTFKSVERWKPFSPRT